MTSPKSKKKSSKPKRAARGKKNPQTTALKMKKLQDKMFRDWKNSK
jgi:hypothetical protein